MRQQNSGGYPRKGAGMTDKQCERCGEVNPAEIHTCSPQEPQIKQRTGDCLLTGVCAAEGHTFTPKYVDRRQWKYDPMTGEPLVDGWPLYSGLPEPVAWAWTVNSGAGYTTRGVTFYKIDIPFAKHIPLYTAPPQREWQGLTEAERLEIIAVGGEAAVLYVTEAKLKEKNT
jgi:hypothetical protein